MSEIPSGGLLVELRRVVSEVFGGVAHFDADKERTFEVLFHLLGHLSRIDGSVSDEEHELAGRLMEEMALPAALRARALAAYAGDDGEVDVLGELERYLAVYPAGSTQAATLVECLLRLARADGLVDAKERAFIDEVTRWLGVPVSYVDWKLQAMMPMHH